MEQEQSTALDQPLPPLAGAQVQAQVLAQAQAQAQADFQVESWIKTPAVVQDMTGTLQEECSAPQILSAAAVDHDDQPDAQADSFELTLTSEGHLDRLRNTLYDLYQRQLLTDVTLVTGGQEFKVHMVVLAAHSGYFHSLLGSPAGNLPMKTYLAHSASSISILVEFLYSGALKLTADTVPDVQVAAVQLQINSAASLCEQYIDLHLSMPVNNQEDELVNHTVLPPTQDDGNHGNSASEKTSTTLCGSNSTRRRSCRQVAKKTKKAEQESAAPVQSADTSPSAQKSACLIPNSCRQKRKYTKRTPQTTDVKQRVKKLRECKKSLKDHTAEVSKKSETDIQLQDEKPGKVPRVRSVGRGKKFFCEFCHKGYVHRMGMRGHWLSCWKKHGGASSNSPPPDVKPQDGPPSGKRKKGSFSRAQGKNARQKKKTTTSEPVPPESSSDVEREDNGGNVGRKSHRCQYCHEPFFNYGKLRAHMFKDHVDSLLPCRLCKYSSTSKTGLARHMRTCHSQKTTQLRRVCDICNHGNINELRLQHHQYLHHGIVPKAELVSCRENGCNYKTPDRTMLRGHVRTVHPKEGPFICDLCGVSVKRANNLSIHIKAVHQRLKPCICEQCGKACTRGGIDAHLLTHKKVKKFKCPHCTFSSHRRHLMKVHLFRKHQIIMNSKSTVYQCDQCPYSAIMKCELQLHKQSHRKVRDVPCSVCGKMFVSIQRLKSHMKFAHSEATFKCGYCAYATTLRHKLNVHVRVVHEHPNYKPYKCSYCDFRCTTSGNCRKHMASRHPGLEIKWVHVGDVAATQLEKEAPLVPLETRIAVPMATVNSPEQVSTFLVNVPVPDLGILPTEQQFPQLVNEPNDVAVSSLGETYDDTSLISQQGSLAAFMSADHVPEQENEANLSQWSGLSFNAQLTM